MYSNFCFLLFLNIFQALAFSAPLENSAYNENTHFFQEHIPTGWKFFNHFPCTISRKLRLIEKKGGFSDILENTYKKESIFIRSTVVLWPRKYRSISDLEKCWGIAWSKSWSLLILGTCWKLTFPNVIPPWVMTTYASYSFQKCCAAKRWKYYFTSAWQKVNQHLKNLPMLYFCHSGTFSSGWHGSSCLWSQSWDLLFLLSKKVEESHQ